MIIDTMKHNRCVLNLKPVPVSRLESLSVSLSKEVIEVWYLGDGRYHGYGFDDEKILRLRAAGAMLGFLPGEHRRVCNNCGRFLELTGQQKSFGRLYKCPGCSVAWWGKPSSLPADQVTRTARKLTADMTKLVKDIAPNASLKHQLRPLGVLNKDEARFEKFKLIDLSNCSIAKRLEIVEEAFVEHLMTGFEYELAKLVANRSKVINDDKLVDKVVCQSTCNHNWGWVGIDETCTHCGATKKDLILGGKSVEDLKEPQDLYDDVDATILAAGQIVDLPPGSKLIQMACQHEWDATIQRCIKCGITQRDFFYQHPIMLCEPVTAKPQPTTGGRLIDLE